MITYERIKEAQDFLAEQWGEDGKKVIVLCAKENPFNNGFTKFLNHCIACGGNWGGLLLSGIKELYPTVWDAIPDDMGVQAFACLCDTLILLGVDTSE